MRVAVYTARESGRTLLLRLSRFGKLRRHSKIGDWIPLLIGEADRALPMAGAVVDLEYQDIEPLL